MKNKSKHLFLAAVLSFFYTASIAQVSWGYRIIIPQGEDVVRTYDTTFAVHEVLPKGSTLSCTLKLNPKCSDCTFVRDSVTTKDTIIKSEKKKSITLVLEANKDLKAFPSLDGENERLRLNFYLQTVASKQYRLFNQTGI